MNTEKEKENNDTSKLGRDKGGKENIKPQWFTEGYIGEVEVNLASTDKCTITIDPSAPFKVEYRDVRFALFAHSSLIEKTTEGCAEDKEQEQAAIADAKHTNDAKQEARPINDAEQEATSIDDAKLVKQAQTFPLGKGCNGLASMLVQIKTSRQKVRFHLKEETSSLFNLVKITLI